MRHILIFLNHFSVRVFLFGPLIVPRHSGVGGRSIILLNSIAVALIVLELIGHTCMYHGSLWKILIRAHTFFSLSGLLYLQHPQSSHNHSEDTCINLTKFHCNRMSSSCAHWGQAEIRRSTRQKTRLQSAQNSYAVSTLRKTSLKF